MGEVAASSANGGKETAEQGGGDGAEQRVKDDGPVQADFGGAGERVRGRSWDREVWGGGMGSRTFFYPTWLGHLGSGAEDELDGLREAIPTGFFSGELAAAFGGEFVELGFAAVFRVAPLRDEPAAFFEAMECGVKGALLDVEDRFGDLADALGDAVAVDGAEGDDFEDEHVEGALEEVGFFGRRHYLLSLCDVLPIVDEICRLSRRE